MKNRIYICIDLKSFYASVECVLRGLDPLTTNLVVADSSRTDKTICLAVSPSLKQYGIPGRARLFEVKEKVREINTERRKHIYHNFYDKSFNDNELKSNKNLKLDFIIATPQMKKYMKYSTDIYKIYLKYFSKDDILVYSIDECFIDITDYLKMYNMSPRKLVTTIIQDIVKETGITATGGIGTNMYLAKVAMDIVAKHAKADKYGVRVAGLDEMSYRKLLWDHKPLTDFWRIGRGISKKLNDNGMETMGDVAFMSLNHENLLFKLFGVNAELLIDHAWGWESCSLHDAKKYKPKSKSLSSGQVLHKPYEYGKAMLIVSEMAELLTLELVKNDYVTDEIFLNIGYDVKNDNYTGPYVKDYIGRYVPKPVHGSIKLSHKTSSTSYITKKTIELYKSIVNSNLFIRRINIAAVNLVKTSDALKETITEQLDLFTPISQKENIEEELNMEKDEKKVQETILKIKEKYGKNSILKGMDLEEGARTIERNKEVGGHKG